MTSSYFSNDFERKALKTRIAEAQELGVDCYLASPEGDIVVKIRPQDSPDISIEQFGIEDDAILSNVRFSFEPPSEDLSFFSTGSIINGRGLQASDFSKLFANHPIESIASIKELSNLFEKYYGGGGDWRVWYAFVQTLSPSVSDEVVQTLVIPLLEAGELGFASREAEDFLRRRGWPESKIKESFCEVTANRRAARSQFQDDTGWSIDAINSSNDLTDAIFSELCDSGPSSAVSTICQFIRAHPPEADVTRLSRIVTPFLSLFGRGYEDMTEEIEERNYNYNSNWRYPEYNGRGGYDGWVSHGDWRDGVRDFQIYTGRLPQEIRSADALAAIIFEQDSPSSWRPKNQDLAARQTMLSMMKNSIIESFVLAQSPYAHVASIRAIVDPFVPFLGRFGHQSLEKTIEKHGWTTLWPLPPCDDTEMWGDWVKFSSAFSR